MLTDVNECQASNGGCGQMCTNAEGSFQCSCREGYFLTADNLSCEGKLGLFMPTYKTIHFLYLPDVNECQMNNGGCDQICINTNGSTLCSCEAGYSLGADNLSCEGRVEPI